MSDGQQLAAFALGLAVESSGHGHSMICNTDFLRSFVGKPSGKSGIDALIRRLERDEFDLIAVGRALLSDAAWGNKVRNGREGDIIGFTPAAMQEL